MKNKKNKKNPLHGLAYAFPDKPNYASPNNYRDITLIVNGQVSTVNRPSFTHCFVLILKKLQHSNRNLIYPSFCNKMLGILVLT
jgi:hypothetical protein